MSRRILDLDQIDFQNGDNKQGALDGLTDVSNATNEHVLTKDTVTGHAVFKVNPAFDASNISSGTLNDNRLSENVPLINTPNNFIQTNKFPQVGIGMGQSQDFDPDNPEKLLIHLGSNGSNTAVTVLSDNPTWMQMNMQNTNNGTSVSTDYIATANNGTQTSNYIDIGINGSEYTDDYVGKANDGYVYVDGANLNIGTVSGGSKIIFFTNGADSYANEKMSIDSDGLVTCQGKIIAQDGILSNHVATVGQLSYKQNSLGDINGIVKGNGSGTYSTASAGTDFLTPTGNGSQLTNLSKTQVGLSNVTDDAQLKASQLDTSTSLGTSDTKVSSQNAVKTYVDTGLGTKLSSISGLNISQLNNDSGYITGLSLDGLSDVTITSPELGDIVKYNGSAWVNGSSNPTTNAGAGVNFFPNETASDISGYDSLLSTPLGDEADETASCNNDKVLIDAYISASGGLGGNKIDAGIWTFNIWGYATNVSANSQIVIDVYKRVTAGTETLLFSVSTPNLATSLGNYIVASTQQEYSINATDRIVIKVSGESSGIGSATVHFVHGGSTHYSYISTPLITRHNDLAGLQGGQAGQYYHVDSTQYTNITNLSGTNSGDETQTTIKNKLGAASASSAGYLTSTDWSAFNNKLSNVTGTNLDNVFTSNGFLVRTGANTYSIDANSYLTSASNLNASNLSSGTVNDARLSSNVTLQGNTFNGNSQLVKTTSAGYFPALNGSLITNLTKSQVGLSNVPDVDCTNATNISSGTLPDLRLSSAVTKLGNTSIGTGAIVLASELANRTNGGSFVVATNTSTQSLAANSVITKVTFPTESSDDKNEFSSSTFTSAIAQKVLVIADIGILTSLANDTTLNVYLYVNGSQKYRRFSLARNSMANIGVTAIIDLNAGDTVGVYASQSSGSTRTLSGSTIMIAQLV